MPPRGWKKPPGFAGYKHKPKVVKKRNGASTSRTAGPHMLSARATLVADETEPTQTAIVTADVRALDDAIDGNAEEHALPADDQTNDGLVSSRLRARTTTINIDMDELSGGETDLEDNDPAPVSASDAETNAEEDEEDNDLAINVSKRPAPRAACPPSPVDDPLNDIPRQLGCNDKYTVNDNLPLLNLSVTLSKKSGHVLPAWLKLVDEWMKLRCEAGAAALERGGRQQHLHVQIMLRMHIAEQDIKMLADELKSLVGWRRGDGSGIYCQTKEFAPGQTWQMMLGYVHKDSTQPHFKICLHNINSNDIVKGIAEWQTAKLSYEDDKILLTRANLFQRLASYRANACPDTDNTFLHDMTDLLNTKKYMLAAMMVTQAGVMRVPAAEAMYKLVKGLKPMEVEDTRDLLFPSYTTGTRYGTANPDERYYSPTPDVNVAQTTPLNVDEGFLSPDQRSTFKPPPPKPDRNKLSPFVQNLLNKNTVRRLSLDTPPSSSRAHASVDVVRPDSPRSMDSGEHESDDDFINDITEDSYNSDAEDNTDVNTCTPVRAGNGKDVVG